MLNINDFYRNAYFLAGVKDSKQFIKFHLPQFGFWGRSNVGKSTLINILCNKSKLAKISKTPGRTREINFFSISDKLLFVDFPGYGFANVPLSVKNSWEILILEYLKSSSYLKLMNILIDIRRGISPNDIKILNLLKFHNRKFQIIFTKSDKLAERKSLIDKTRNILATLHCSCNIFFVSKKSKSGIKDLQHSVLEYLS